jgi:hypothetical protein
MDLGDKFFMDLGDKFFMDLGDKFFMGQSIIFYGMCDIFLWASPSYRIV